MAGSKYGDGAEISGSLAVSGSATFNEESKDVDFRIESDNRPYAFYVDAGNDRIGLGCFIEPTHQVEIQHEGGDGDQGLMIVRYDGAVYTNNLLGGVGFDNADPVAGIPSQILEASSYVAGYAAENHSITNKGGYLVFGTANIGDDINTATPERMRIDSSGNVGIGTDAPDYTLDVAGDIGVDQYIYHNGDGNTLINFADDKITLKAGGKAMITMEEKGSAPHEITINDGSNNIDFVVKGNGSNAGNPGMKFDASNNRLGINGVGSPSYELDVAGDIGLSEYIYHKGDDDTFIRFETDQITVKAGDVSFINITEDDDQDKISLNEGRADVDFIVRSPNEALALYLNSDNEVFHINHGESGFKTKIHSTNGEAITVNNSGVILNEDGHATNDFRVESDNNDHMLFVDAGNDVIGIGTSSPKNPLDIYEMGGLILGISILDNGGAATNADYDLTTTMVVPTNRWYVTFTAPASGKVEVQFQGYCHSDTSAAFDFVYLGLSDSATYNSAGAQYEKKVRVPSNDAASATAEIINHSWYISGLTAGTSYTYYVGTAARNASTHTWKYGGTDSTEYPDLFIRALSLPNTVATD